MLTQYCEAEISFRSVLKQIDNYCHAAFLCHWGLSVDPFVPHINDSYFDQMQHP